MFVVCVNFTLKKNAVSEFMPLMQTQAAKALELESGCKQFDICIDEADPANVFLYEIYDNKAVFDGHLVSDHFLTFDAAVTDMIEAKSVQTYKLTNRSI